MRPEFWLVITCPMLLGGCAGGMIPGTIYSSDGKVMSFEIEKAHRTGVVRATDPSSGEKFIGNYVGIKERLNVNTSRTATAGSAVVSGFGHGSIEANTANATAFFKGDKGTMLNCEMKIEAGLSPHGIGTCDDNQGKKYRLQF